MLLLFAECYSVMIGECCVDRMPAEPLVTVCVSRFMDCNHQSG